MSGITRNFAVPIRETRWLRFPVLLIVGFFVVFAIIALLVSEYWPVGLALVAAVVGGGVVGVWCRRAMRFQRLELGRLSQSLERRAEQVAALSHELRTPLSMIKGAADLLLEESPGPVTRVQGQFLRSIAQQCNHVIGLCEGLLLQAKIETGVFEPRLEPTDVLALARDVVVAMRPLCAQRNQRISLDTPQVGRMVVADPALLLQAMTNLLSNASRFTSNGGAIGVRVIEIDDGVAVYVTDDGDGMTREQRAKLFRRVVTGRPLTDGTGLGLVITKDIIELHGGSIMVDTTSRRGTTFVFTLLAGGPA
jgi:two-component system, OmpR family, sensor kinase